MLRELIERALAAIKGRITRQIRRQAERRARKDEARQITPMHPWGPRHSRRKALKPNRGGKHTRRGPYLAPGSTPDDITYAIWHTTKPLPWQTKDRNRRRNKVARISRRRNRVTR